MSCVGVTGKIGESKFEWEIANFFALPATRLSYYNSPSFIFQKTSLHLKMYPAGAIDSKTGFLSVYLANESNDPLHVNTTLCIKKADGTMVGGGSDDVCIKSAVAVGCRNFYEKSCLQQNESEMVPSGTLTIVCILKPKHDGKQDITKVEKMENSQEKQSHMSDRRRLTGNVYYIL